MTEKCHDIGCSRGDRFCSQLVYDHSQCTIQNEVCISSMEDFELKNSDEPLTDNYYDCLGLCRPPSEKITKAFERVRCEAECSGIKL